LANIEGQRYFELNVKFIKEAKNLDEAPRASCAFRALKKALFYGKLKV